MTKKLLEYPRDDTRLNPLQILLKIKTWGIELKRVINKTNEWATWQWANAKIDKEFFHCLNILYTFLRKIWKITFYTCHGFFQRTHEFEKACSRTFFYKPFEQFVKRRFGNDWQLVLNKVHEASKTIVCNSKMTREGAS
jgi:hypothetical protein